VEQEEEEEKTVNFVRVSVSLDRQTIRQLEELLKAYRMQNRSKFIKKMIRKEYFENIEVLRSLH
jgi:metal-responsive CopG/Arc/MetJ family transcriptional regulator